MDNLVLIRVSAVLDRTLSRSVLNQFRQETPHRFRLVFEREGWPLSVTVSLDPPRPWIGRPVGWRGPPRRPPGPFAARCDKSLRHLVVRGVAKGQDRSVALQFVDGQELVCELAPHRSNAFLLDSEGRVQACARRPSASRRELAAGGVYRTPGLPPGILDPVTANAAEIDARLERARGEGSDRPTPEFRNLFGISPVTAGLVQEESRLTGRSPGRVLVPRLKALVDGSADPVLEGPEPALEAAREGTSVPDGWRLLPWEPAEPAEPPLARMRLEDAAATAGLYHGALELTRESETRGRSIHRILAAEIARQRRAESRIAADLEGFCDPDRFRVQAEALLAGLHDARRHGDHVFVPDPYDPEQRSMSVPVPAGQSLQQAAETLFQRHRRARRGLLEARRRSRQVAERRARLEQMQTRFADAGNPEATAELERAMRDEGVAVGLEAPRGKRSGIASPSRPRLEGVRILQGRGGQSILVGKGGRENDRLTFKLAGAEDFWFHALGVAGAHVVVRNESREPRPPRDLLRQAAEVAAWYSEARNQAQADVQWTRRKYVRRLKGASPGTVKVKKSETIRVRPGLPARTD